MTKDISCQYAEQYRYNAVWRSVAVIPMSPRLNSVSFANLLYSNLQFFST